MGCDRSRGWPEFARRLGHRRVRDVPAGIRVHGGSRGALSGRGRDVRLEQAGVRTVCRLPDRLDLLDQQFAVLRRDALFRCRQRSLDQRRRNPRARRLTRLVHRFRGPRPRVCDRTQHLRARRQQVAQQCRRHRALRGIAAVGRIGRRRVAPLRRRDVHQCGLASAGPGAQRSHFLGFDRFCHDWARIGLVHGRGNPGSTTHGAARAPARGAADSRDLHRRHTGGAGVGAVAANER